MNAPFIAIARQGDTLDLLCWRHFGQTAGVTEIALEMNPGLARLGELLPEGTAVGLPTAAPAPVRQTVQLWT
jgi:phage tail protein X